MRLQRKWVWITGSALLLAIAAVVAWFLSRGVDSDYTPAFMAKVDLILIGRELEAYKQQNGSYPTTAQGLSALAAPGSLRLPHQSAGTFRPFPRDPWERDYVYRFPSTRSPKRFDLFSLGPDGVESKDDVCWQP